MGPNNILFFRRVLLSSMRSCPKLSLEDVIGIEDMFIRFVLPCMQMDAIIALSMTNGTLHAAQWLRRIVGILQHWRLTTYRVLQLSHTADNEFEARAIVLVCSRKYDCDVSLLGDRVHLRKSVIHFEGCRKNGGAPLYCELLQTMPKMCIHTLVAEDLIHALSAPNEDVGLALLYFIKLANARAAIDFMAENSLTALMLACKNGNNKCARELLKAGAAVDATGKDGVTRSALRFAAQNGHDQVARELLEAKADPNQADDQLPIESIYNHKLKVRE